MALPDYRHSGAAALVRLHENQLVEFVQVWKEAKGAGVSLPETSDPSYESLDALLRHLLRAARGYMVWCCESLGLDNPAIEPTPVTEEIAADADRYLAHVLERWRTPLTGVEEKRFYTPEHKSRWGVLYCIDAMLEHAVMHPLRHTYQLRNLMKGK